MSNYFACWYNNNYILAVSNASVMNYRARCKSRKLEIHALPSIRSTLLKNLRCNHLRAP